jgi:hypothetical protein
MAIETHAAGGQHPTGTEATLAAAERLERQLLGEHHSLADADPWFATRFEAFVDDLRGEAAAEADAVGNPGSRPRPIRAAESIQPAPVAVAIPEVAPALIVPVQITPAQVAPLEITPSETPELELSAFDVSAYAVSMPDVEFAAIDLPAVPEDGPVNDLERAFWNDGATTWRDRIPKVPVPTKHIPRRRSTKKLSAATVLQGGAAVLVAVAVGLRMA